MDKKVIKEFSIGVFLLALIIIAGVFWFNRIKQSKISQALAAKQKQTQADQTGGSCKPRYYEGEARLQGWLAQDDRNNNGNGFIVRIRDEDIRNLPVAGSNTLTNFTVKLIDPTDEVKNSLRLATKEKPAIIIIHGYAEICQQPPLVSIGQAKIAFKKI